MVAEHGGFELERDGCDLGAVSELAAALGITGLGVCLATRKCDTGEIAPRLEIPQPLSDSLVLPLFGSRTNQNLCMSKTSKVNRAS